MIKLLLSQSIESIFKKQTKRPCICCAFARRLPNINFNKSPPLLLISLDSPTEISRIKTTLQRSKLEKCELQDLAANQLFFLLIEFHIHRFVLLGVRVDTVQSTNYCFCLFSCSYALGEG